MFDMLDMRVTLLLDVERETWVCEAVLWDAEQYIASKVWEGSNAGDLLNMTRPFWLYWSNLYYDRPELTDEPRNKAGHTQMSLGL